MEELFPNIFKVEVPLPGNALGALNSYVVIADKHNLIIDTGFDHPVCEGALMAAIAEIGLDLEKTDLLITHLHPDHFGLAPALNEKGVRVLMGKKDRESLHGFYDFSKTDFDALIQMAGLPAAMTKTINPNEMRDYQPYTKMMGIPITSLGEGDCLEVGDYRFDVIDVPGHTIGHIALVEQDRRFMFGGDLILKHVSPNIARDGSYDALGGYIHSLDKVDGLHIGRVLPAHGDCIDNPHERIDQLKQHHEKRMMEVEDVLRDGSKAKSIIEVAKHLHWNTISTFAKMSTVHQLFALQETWAHLDHLVALNRVNCSEEQGVLLFSCR